MNQPARAVHRRAPLPSLPHRAGWTLVAIALVAVCAIPKTGGELIHKAADLLSGPTNTTYLVVGIGLLLLLAYLGRSVNEVKRVAAVMLGETVFVHLVKLTTGKLLNLTPRPSGGWDGFPSGHSAASCALAYLLSERVPRLAPLWYAGAALISWSRLEAGAHYPYQIVTGAIVGLTIAIMLSPRFPSPNGYTIQKEPVTDGIVPPNPER